MSFFRVLNQNVPNAFHRRPTFSEPLSTQIPKSLGIEEVSDASNNTIIVCGTTKKFPELEPHVIRTDLATISLNLGLSN